MRKAMIAALCVLALAGCQPSEGYDRTPTTHYTFMQELPDGRSVLCVWAVGYNSAGLSCDWEGLHRE